MSSRSEILEAIRNRERSGNTQRPMPDLQVVYGNNKQMATLRESFIRSARKQGAEIALSGDIPDPNKWIASLYPETENILSNVERQGFPATITDQSGKPDLRQVDVSIIRGAFGVAENGSIWIPDTNLTMRVIPFICTHLIIVLDGTQIVDTMHEAYRKTQLEKTGFGVFITGPSKTADIEQSLVIGAQGPKSVMILLETE